MIVELRTELFDNEHPAAVPVALEKVVELHAAPVVGDLIEGIRVREVRRLRASRAVKREEDAGREYVAELATVETQFGYTLDQLLFKGWGRV